MWIALQIDGSQIRIEDWAVQMWRHGQLMDPFILKPLYGAVRIYKECAW